MSNSSNSAVAGSPTIGAGSTLWRAEIFVLFGIALLHNVDRTIMSALLEPIKHEFGISDAATGALSGMAFGLAYAALGLPFARIADVANRRWMLALSLAAWSALTLACGFAVGFWTFFIARLGVGVFEAAGVPAMHALCADRLPKDRRSSAASLLFVGFTLGAMIGISSGGVIADHAGWRAAFWVAGIPGLVLAPLAFRFLVEPRPTARLDHATLWGAPMRAAYRLLLGKPAFRYLLLGAATNALWYWGTATWFITFLVRSHGMSLSQAAFGYGILTGISTLLGVVLNGVLGDRLVKRDIRWLGWLPAAALVACAVFAIPVYLVASGPVALLLYAIASAFTGVITPAQFAATYALAGTRARASAVAILQLSIYIVGLAVAAAAVGALSDALAPTRGENSLSASLLVTTVALPLAAFFFHRSTKFFARDIEQD